MKHKTKCIAIMSPPWAGIESIFSMIDSKITVIEYNHSQKKFIGTLPLDCSEIYYIHSMSYWAEQNSQNIIESLAILKSSFPDVKITATIPYLVYPKWKEHVKKQRALQWAQSTVDNTEDLLIRLLNINSPINLITCDASDFLRNYKKFNIQHILSFPLFINKVKERELMFTNIIYLEKDNSWRFLFESIFGKDKINRLGEIGNINKHSSVLFFIREILTLKSILSLINNINPGKSFIYVPHLDLPVIEYKLLGSKLINEIFTTNSINRFKHPKIVDLSLTDEICKNLNLASFM